MKPVKRRYKKRKKSPKATLPFSINDLTIAQILEFQREIKLALTKAFGGRKLLKEY